MNYEDILISAILLIGTLLMSRGQRKRQHPAQRNLDRRLPHTRQPARSKKKQPAQV